MPLADLFLVLRRPSKIFVTRAARPYPDLGSRECVVDGLAVCQTTPCLESTHPEATAIHARCFHYFRHNCPGKAVLDRLWQNGAWRQPWDGAPAVFLFRDAKLPSSQALASVVRRLGRNSLFQAMQCLPEEIIMQIYELSEESPFWSLVKAIDLSLHLTVSVPVSPSQVSLDTIRQWRRGQRPQLVASDSIVTSLPIVRLTLDSRGVYQVERLPKWPQEGRKAEDRLAFIVDYVARFKDAEALFEVC